MTIVIERFILSAAVAALIYTVTRMRKGILMPAEKRFGESEFTSEEGLEKGGFGIRNSWKNLTWAAGIPIPFFIFLFIVIELSALVCLSLWAVFESRVPGILAFVILPVATFSILVEIARQRALKFEEKLIQAIELMISALQSGDTLHGALEGVAENAQTPVKEEFQKLLVKLDLGFHIKRALAPLVIKFDSEGLRLFASSLTAKIAMGGDLTPMLKSLSKVLRERHRFRIKVNSQMAGAKVAALMIGFSPYLLMLMFWFYKRDWIERIFNHPNGPSLFVAAVCLQLLGFLGIVRMQRIEI